MESTVFPFNEEIVGSGPLHVVALHGWGQRKELLLPLVKTLNKFFPATYHLFDLPGFGKSPLPETPLSTQEIAKLIHLHLERSNIQTPVMVMGHSFGGKVAMSLSAEYPGRVSQLVLMATSGIPMPVKAKVWWRRKFLRWSGRLLKLVDRIFGSEYFAQYFTPRFGSRDYLNAKGVMRDMLVKTVNEDYTPLLSKITCPTLLLWGELDGETPPGMAKILEQKISSSQLILFPNKDHYLFDDVGHHLIARKILAFLGVKA